jgi:hypothetical protein
MVCCSANPLLSATAPAPPLPFRIQPEFHHIELRPLEISVSIPLSPTLGSVRRSELGNLHRQVLPVLTCGVQNSSLARAGCIRTEASRSEHDLNLAILYAVQSGFRYSASLFYA